MVVGKLKSAIAIMKVAPVRFKPEIPIVADDVAVVPARVPGVNDPFERPLMLSLTSVPTGILCA